MVNTYRQRTKDRQRKVKPKGTKNGQLESIHRSMSNNRKERILGLCQVAIELSETDRMRRRFIEEIAEYPETALEVYKENKNGGIRNIILKAFEIALDLGKNLSAEASVIVAKSSMRICSRKKACGQIRGNVEAIMDVATYTIYDDTALAMFVKLERMGKMGAVNLVSCENPGRRQMVTDVISRRRIETGGL